jgi:catechol 2,3-dioxygenase
MASWPRWAYGEAMSAFPPDPEEATALGAPAHGEISAATRVGAVHLTVSGLARSLDYYERVIGLRVHERRGECATLGVGGGDLLVLVEQPGARPVRGYCGLYHFALLLPGRADLARWLAHAARDRVPLVGMSDHFVSEAIYLSDPDGHGIEIYWDRPRELWEGRVAERMTTLPLDTSSLLAELVAPLSGSLDPGGESVDPGGESVDPEEESVDPLKAPFDGLPVATTMGHVHLCVADIPRTIAFYRDVLGFALMASLGGQAAFLSAGGYHHHLGANTWESAGAGQPPEGSATLRQATIVLPGTVERDLVVARVAAAGYELRYHDNGALVHDPSGNPILLAGP